MGFLDRRPFSASEPDGRALLAALLAIYDQGPAVRELVLAAGLRPAEFSWTSPMSQVWPEILRKAANQGRLRRLITEVARDPGSAAYDVIARLVAEPAEIQPSEQPEPASAPARTGKPVASWPFDLLTYYSPSGFMGDIGDIKKDEEPGNDLVRMMYEAKRRGPHEWDHKYIAGKINPRPCRFAGIMLLDGDWGRTPRGYDLRGSSKISWEARSLIGIMFVRFLAGGVDWIWDEKAKSKAAAPYPDSLPLLQLGQPELAEQWQRFEFPLDKNVRAADLRAVIAPFGWIISLDSNQGHDPPGMFILEVRNISYEAAVPSLPETAESPPELPYVT
jgi:hypothetical protein